MMKKNIVLIIGAGASHDYHNQFALGHELFKQIKKRTNEPDSKKYLSGIIDNLSNEFAGNNPKDIRIKFHQELLKYEMQYKEYSSIDHFIHKNSTNADFSILAKFSIVFHILGYEGESKKRNPKKISWLDQLYSFISKHCLKNNSEMEFNIINFNYDRLIEEYMLSKGNDKMLSFIDSSIIHVYGKVGNLRIQTKNDDFLDFGHDNSDYETILKNKENILLIYERDKDKNKELIIAQMALLNANRVLFFGYGFDKKNNHNLGLHELEDKTIIPFCRDKNSRNKFDRCYENLWNIKDNKIEYAENLSAIEYFEKYLIN